MRSALLRTAPILLAAALAAPIVSAQSEPEYHATWIGDMVEQVFPGVPFPGSRARALNENGDMVGEAKLDGGRVQGWIYTVEHGLVALPLLPGYSSSVALDISERDVAGDLMIVGGGVPGSAWDLFLGEGALWRFSTVTGTVLETRALGTPSGFDDGIAVGVNNSGKVVGFSEQIGPFAVWKYDVASQVLETFDFPYRPTAINNLDQIVGGPYRGDLFGNYADLGTAPATHSTRLWDINDQGWVMGRAGTSQSDGAGHFYAAIVRFKDTTGWTSMGLVSHLSLPGGINEQGDFISASRVFLDDLDQEFSIGGLLAPEFHTVDPGLAAGINAHRQVVATWGHAVLLTPLGEMIIPGDVNGDVQVNLDDHCAWLSGPIDLDGDGDVDSADEAWLIDRLAVFGFTVQDCNANGVDDHCDITSALSADCNGNDVPDECEPDCNGDGIPDSCEPDCNANGIPDPCDVAQGLSEDCNQNGIPDECDQGGVVQVLRTFDPPLQILQGQTRTDELMVLEPGIIEDVDFTFDIDYRIGFLTVLLSHDGVTATLIDLPGVPDEGPLGNGQLGYDIVLDDEGTGGPIEDEGNFGSPFDPIVSPPSYTPDEPLALFDGMSSEGIWTITVITSPTWGSPVEEFNDWGLTVTLAPTAVPPCACQDSAVNYCTSTPNSTGVAATMGSNLECIVADNSFVLRAEGVPDQPGLFFYGPGTASTPFGNGTRCVAGPFHRLGAEQASGGVLTHAVDFTTPPTATGTILPASTWYFQAWFRDPQGGGTLFDLSDGLEVTFQ